MEEGEEGEGRDGGGGGGEGGEYNKASVSYSQYDSSACQCHLAVSLFIKIRWTKDGERQLLLFGDRQAAVKRDISL